MSEKRLATTFTDLLGDTHTVKLTLGHAEDLYEQTELDFMKALHDINQAYIIIGKMSLDLPLFHSVIHFLTDPGVPNDREYRKRFDGNTIAEACEAIDEAFTNFYHPSKRAAVVELKESYKNQDREGSIKIIQGLNQQIQSQEMQEIMNEANQKVLDDVQKNIQQLIPGEP